MTDVAYAGEFVRLEVDEGVGTIRLDRPPMNALSVQVQDGSVRAAEAAGAARDVRAVVVYGGEKVFAAGADIKEMQAMSYVDMVDRSPALQELLHRGRAHPEADGRRGDRVRARRRLRAGALRCDFRIAGENAKLGQPEILLGVIPGAGGTQRLARLVGPARAKDLIFTGRFVAADEALRDRAGRPGGAGRRGVRRGAGLGAHVRRRAGVCVARRQGGGRPRPGDRPGHRARRSSGCCSPALFATEDREIGMTSFVEHGPGKATFEGA